MKIVVCVKHVPDTAEADVVITPDKKGIKKEGLAFGINEWDEYAVEEAILMKEKYGGEVVAITIGGKESEDTLRRCLAKGADRAIRIEDPALEGSDAYALAKVLCAVIKGMEYDIIFTGAQAGDDGFGQVGQTLAELLGIPHAALVTKVEPQDGKAKVHRELEGGLEEVLEIQLPAVLAVQTGINEPRYVSIMGIRKAKKKELKVLSLSDIGLSPDEVGEKGSLLTLEELYIPPVEKMAEILTGAPDETATKLAGILDERGLIPK
ncbi:electron transfer flavoprotein subunit beta/FixA family protein [Candidatus Alkanophaga liquidiphilum]|nr:Electron transfer flavoprotein [Candidatus Alkanophaga liquidiphilum]RLG38304.1 MAG: electron transfer flavoprotein subunit beta [Candidatus Alkanophagales archaeon]